MALCFRFVCFLFAHIPHHRPPPPLQDSLDFHLERKAKRSRAPSLTRKTLRHHHRHRRREGLPEKKNKEDNEHVCPIRGQVSLPVSRPRTNTNRNTPSLPPPLPRRSPSHSPGTNALPAASPPKRSKISLPPPSSTSPLLCPPRRKESGPESSTNDGQHQKRGRTSATNGGGYQQRGKKSAIRALAIRLSSRAFEARKTTTGADTKRTGKFPSPPHRTALL